jgi:hypothetical protein
MYTQILLLSDLAYACGLIGLNELEEREAVVEWMESDTVVDPRVPGSEGETPGLEADNDPVNWVAVVAGQDSNEPLALVVLSTWIFTLGDVDCFPSVPHGHWKSKTTPWPKLDPFCGRVYRNTRTEDAGARLPKTAMRQIWRDKNFVSFCRDQIHWYSSFAPHYNFNRARYGKYVFPNW